MILVTGIKGGLAQRVAARLLGAGHDVVGVDYRKDLELASDISHIPVYQASYNKTAFEDVFRRHAFSTVLHLGRVGNLSETMGKRFDLNVLGSQKVMSLSAQHRVRTLVVLSTFHIYGADARNPTPISEEEPLRAGFEFPEIADAIQLDNMAWAWVYQHPEVRTTVLRPCNVIGPHIHNTMATFLRMSRVPYVAGFNPMTQFLHEDDLSGAILSAISGTGRGVFNVAGRDMVPWRTALEMCSVRGFPLPAALSRRLLSVVFHQPEYLVNFLKYPCIINDAAFRRTFGWRPLLTLDETLWTTVEDARKGVRRSEFG